MKDFDLVRLKDELGERGILISFSGPFSHSIIEELGKVVRNHLENTRLSRTAMMDVFAVYVEQAQNVGNYLRHWEQEPSGERIASSGIVVIARDGERYVVSSGNLMVQIDVAPLVVYLEQLRALDKAGLKALHKQKLRQPLSEAGGGGLGLIEMARKATMPLQYALTTVDAGVFFTLRVVI
ncbi:MAG: hypothetical protein H6974_14845 [Gammaproteobacteria bacterium]|nr:hypothetical protein [Gammaproteobacteria bacterium]MCP5198038.1 hypothetical protein [Gammaproteobacteria bacterium]